MAEKTPNFDLTKPLPSEFYDVRVQNENMDKIDQALQDHKEGIESIQTGQAAKADLVNGKVPANQLPSFIDDVVEGYLYNGAFYEEAAHTTLITPEKGKIYTDLSTNKTYRWGGSAYIEISQSLALGETPQTAFRGDQGKKSYEHTFESIIGDTGVHDLRYYNNKLQVKMGDNWENANAGGGVGPQVKVNITTGSTVHCSDGTTDLTGTVIGESFIFDIPNYGTWNIYATKDGQTTATETVVINVAQLYTVNLEYFTATLTVTTKAGASVTAVNGSKTLTATANNSGKAVFNLTLAGNYSVKAIYDEVESNTQTVNATTNGGSYTATCTFIVLTITVDSGSNVTVSKGGVTKQATSTGTAVFYLPSTGTWTATATLLGQTATETVNCSSYGNFNLTLNYFRYFGLKIQIGNTDPATAITYTDDATGHAIGYDAWKDEVIFKNIKPCVVKDGVFQYYLNPANLSQKADGTAATINSTSAGDVMIEIPKLGYKMTTDGTYHYINITDDPAAPGYCYRAHALDNEGDCDKIYIGAYLASATGNKLYSISGQAPATNITLTNARSYAQARGTGYQLLSFYPLTLLQCLYLMMYKNRNGQTALGRGFVDGNSAKTNTGGTNAKGVCYGETTGKQQMCFLNIEDFWGNLFCWIDGIFGDASRNIKTAFKNFADDGSSYPYTKSSGLSSDTGDWMQDIQGTNEGGFVFKLGSGSATTYYADAANLYASRCASFGGTWNNGDSAGPFRFSVGYAASNSNAYLGARLMFKHKAA